MKNSNRRQAGYATLTVLVLTAVLVSVLTTALQISSTARDSNRRFSKDIENRAASLTEE